MNDVPNSLKFFVVLYRIKPIENPLEQPLGFKCQAENADHAEEQAMNSYPDAEILWLHEGDSDAGMEQALKDYFSSLDW